MSLTSVPGHVSFSKPLSESIPAEGDAQARALWIVSPGHAEIRSQLLPSPALGEARVRTLHSGISRGTETLVFRGEVPVSEYQRMRAPFQVGEFPGPVKYGYISVGRVEQGPDGLVGRTVFCLYPHQTAYNAPAHALSVVPDGVPAARAVLAANLETAVNALWDAAPRIGDRIAVVGAGTLGLLAAWLAVRVIGCEVEVIDVSPGRAAIARQLGASFALPEHARSDADLVIHASGHGAGLATALGLAAFEATVLDLSWYGSTAVTLPLGAAFHARRLTLRSSQVGQIATAQRARWTYARRMALVLRLLEDPVLDLLINESARFDELPSVLARLAAGPSATLCQRIDYPAVT